MSVSVTAMTIEKYLRHRDLDVIYEETDLDNHEFVVEEIKWRLRNSEVSRRQEIIVKYKNSFVRTRAAMKIVRKHRWNGERQVANVIKHDCSDGRVYEVIWNTYIEKLSQMLPPHGCAYELVANFLLREQELRDSEMHDNDDDDDDPDPDPDSNINDDDDDDNSMHSGQGEDDDDGPGDSESGDDDDASDDDHFSVDKILRMNAAFRDMYNSRHRDSTVGSPDSASM